MSSPEYRVILREADKANGFAPGDVICELENVKNLGWSEYANDVGEAFFTLTQEDPKTTQVGNVLDDLVHCQILRDGTLVWAGWLGDTDENETDVVFYAYSYVAALFWLHSDWDQEWAGDTIGDIVGDLMTRAKTGLSESALEWVTNGTIQDPVTESDGSTAITLPEYSINYKRILFALQELTAMAISDTTNKVLFEITPDGEFNLWKDRSISQTDELWEYGGVVAGFNRIRSPLDSRNVILGVGSSPHDVVLRKTNSKGLDMAARSRREEAVFYSWVRDEDEMIRINKHRLERGVQDDNHLMLSFTPGTVPPYRADDQVFRIGDMVPVKIDHGATQIDDEKLVTGQQVLLYRGMELVQAIIQDAL